MREKIENVVIFGPMLAVILLILVCASMGCCNEPIHSEIKLERRFEPCRHGGKDPKALGKTRIMQGNETTGAVHYPEIDNGGCMSIVVGSADGKPTVLVATVKCAMKEGPFYTVGQIVNPHLSQEWSLPLCPYYSFAVETHVIGSIAWTPYFSKQWSRSEEGGWGYE